MKIPHYSLNKALVLAAGTAALIATTTYTHAALIGPRERANLSYDVYIGSSKMFKIGLLTTLTSTSYSSRMKLKPKGLAKLFANIKMVMAVQGKLHKSGVEPTSFSFYRKKKKKKKTSKINWGNGALPSTDRSYKISSSKTTEISKAINPGIADPLSAFLRLGLFNTTTPCGKDQRVYDGGKVYDLKFKLLKKTRLKPDSKSSYSGPAFKCRLRHQPVAGYSRKDLAKARKNPAVFTVWFAPVHSAVLAKVILLPVAAAGKIKGRNFTAFANKSSFAGKPL